MNSTPSFCVYVDESGEEGFVFHPDGSGSSRWLVLAAVITRREDDLEVVQLLKKVRTLLKRTQEQSLHFCRLEHTQRIPYVREIGGAGFRVASVLIHKPSIKEPEKFQNQKHLLYRYGCRLLLERISWFCRDHRIKGQGDGKAEIIFSNRAQMSYDELREYIHLLHNATNSLKVSIDWSAIDPDQIRPVQHTQMAGLQVADAVASSLFAAVNPNRYGDTEDKYARLLAAVLYRHKGTVFGYGLKFWPDNFITLKTRNPHLAGFEEWVGK